MAYMTNEQVKEKRESLKAIFPTNRGWKFSVTQPHKGSLHINLMQYPEGFDFPDHAAINHYWTKECCERLALGEAECEIVEAIVDVANEGHWDKSDIQTDYFHCSWYITIEIGKWNKPCQMKEAA